LHGLPKDTKTSHALVARTVQEEIEKKRKIYESFKITHGQDKDAMPGFQHRLHRLRQDSLSLAENFMEQAV